MAEGTTVKREPFERVLSQNVKVLFGFKDAHAELRVRTPIKIVVPVSLTPVHIAGIRKSFSRAYDWAMKPESERAHGKGDIEDIIDPRGKVTYGFPDAHVDISVRVVATISPWLTAGINREELLLGKPVMEEVDLWAQLPEDVRMLQGI